MKCARPFSLLPPLTRVCACICKEGEESSHARLEYVSMSRAYTIIVILLCMHTFHLDVCFVNQVVTVKTAKVLGCTCTTAILYIQQICWLTTCILYMYMYLHSAVLQKHMANVSVCAFTFQTLSSNSWDETETSGSSTHFKR